MIFAETKKEKNKTSKQKKKPQPTKKNKKKRKKKKASSSFQAFHFYQPVWRPTVQNKMNPGRKAVPS